MGNPCQSEFVNATQFARIVGCNPAAVTRVAAAGKVRVLMIPGCAPKYNRADAEGLVVISRAGEEAGAIAS